MQDPDLIFGDPQKQSTLLPIPGNYMYMQTRSPFDGQDKNRCIARLLCVKTQVLNDIYRSYKQTHGI